MPGPREGVTPNQPGGHTGTRPAGDREWLMGYKGRLGQVLELNWQVVSDSEGVFRADFRQHIASGDFGLLLYLWAKTKQEWQLWAGKANV